MRYAMGLIGALAMCTPCHAQGFPTSLVANDKAMACRDPEKLPDASMAYEKKDPRAFRRTGCRFLKTGQQVSVEYAQRVGNEKYHLIRISWRRGPTLWAYSYDFQGQ